MSYLKKEIFRNVFRDLEILHKNYLRMYGVEKQINQFIKKENNK